MGPLHYSTLLAGLALLSASAVAQQSGSCPAVSGRIAAPKVAAGYEARLVATGLSKPRGILFDAAGNLLVVEQGKGIAALTLKDQGGSCVTLGSKKTLVSDTGLNHGLQLSVDGKTLYASTVNNVYSYAYNAQTAATSGTRKTLITGMSNSGHSTRTLLIIRKVPGLLLVSRGSAGNIDNLASDVSSTHSTIKIFNVSAISNTANYQTDGELLGWGLRNSVGIGEEPLTGGIYSVENSMDQMTRDGKDVHNDNPGEEMNFHGFLNGTDIGLKGKNYGYPQCFAAWKPADLPRNTNIKVGTQFVPGTETQAINDKMCSTDRIAPRLTFEAHIAPLDIKFDSTGSKAWVTMHGSWNRSPGAGYKLVAIDFAGGQPKEPATSSTAAKDILTNADVSRCPGSCFRPVGLAWDSKGRLFMSSDSSGEIYVITKTGGEGIDTAAALRSAPSSRAANAVAPRMAIPTADLLKALGALPYLM